MGGLPDEGRKKKAIGEQHHQSLSLSLPILLHNEDFCHAFSPRFF
jgi:hypothetical protein